MPTNLNPKSTTSAVILTSTGSYDKVTAGCPIGAYTGSANFLSGASMQVAYVYKKLGGDVIDIELTPGNVYAAYEEAVLEYSYIVNLHQSKNSLSDTLGDTTGTFDHLGAQLTGPTGSNLRFPRFQVSYAQRVGDGVSTLGGYGGTTTIYSGSIVPRMNTQDYNLQAIVQTASDSGKDESGNAVTYAGKVDNERIFITRVYFKSPRAMWRFYGYYGGVGVVGNYSTYGQFADDSTFEIIPTWQNKLQAIMYEDSIWTRTSHYSYALKNNKLKLYPNPSYYPFMSDKIWFEFYIKKDATATGAGYEDGVKGVNNMNTLPYSNIPFRNINAIGKQWIRKYALSVCKEMLGQIRGKFTTVPIPGDSVTLNHAELLSQAKTEQAELRDKLVDMLAAMEYTELIKKDSEKSEATATTFKNSPLPIFVG
ncbi:hypothetical protein CMI37_25520 [Candidatus Pacearchaeota archaeon]|nr:hypothetical protein [Candidatus Pacearchaeota archaeon]|tara:strand:- start:410 stop:1678 length:1269 start_codon:yes stop_codon:yes gene_type:complete